MDAPTSSIFSGTTAHLLWWKLFHIPVRKRAEGFQILHFHWSFSSDIMAVKGLKQTLLFIRFFENSHTWSCHFYWGQGQTGQTNSLKQSIDIKPQSNPISTRPTHHSCRGSAEPVWLNRSPGCPAASVCSGTGWKSPDVQSRWADQSWCVDQTVLVEAGPGNGNMLVYRFYPILTLLFSTTLSMFMCVPWCYSDFIG